MTNTPHESESVDWSSKEAVAEELVPVIGRLYRENGVVLSVHGRSLLNISPIDIVRIHRFARHVEGAELPIDDTARMLDVLAGLNPGPASIDVARLHAAFRASGASDLGEWVSHELATIAGHKPAGPGQGRDVVLYGFGRIGRLVARILLARASDVQGLRLRAIVVRKGGDADLVKRASLLRRDSVHGPFNGSITVDESRNVIVANGTEIQVVYANDPASIDYTAYGISDAIVVDNTGKWRDEKGLSQHLESTGVARVLLTAPGKGSLKNVVYGINHKTITDDDRIVTAASCTTNAITPVLKVINDEYGVQYGHVETVHSFTNDQNLIDNFHSGDRRGRSAVLNMVISETGAASAVAKALPELAGKLTGNAIRVPTPDVSMAILNLTLDREVTKDELNGYLRNVALNSRLRHQVDYIESAEVVSTDFLGSRRAGIVDGLATITSGNHAVVYVWYDNEYGYSHQVVRVLEKMGGIVRPFFPKPKD
ncbi:MAG: glyceraldehyde-3-phosphate dehydrogenase [Microbacteriaceae bacterium]